MKKLILILLLLVGISYGQKQSLYAQYPSLLFREVFNDEQSTRMNGGVPTAVTFSQGSGVFNGSSSKITFPNLSKGTYTIRFRFKNINLGATQFLFDATNFGNYVYLESNGIISISSGTKYVDGIATTNAVTSTTKEIVISGLTIVPTGYPNFHIGCRGNGTQFFFNGYIDQVEIFKGTLSASEISNMYLGVHHKDLTITPLIDFNSTAGQIKDFRGNTITNTATTIKRAGSIFSADFNGTTSKLDFGNIDALTGDITIVGWVKARGYGESNIGRIIGNEKLMFMIDNDLRLRLYSDGSTVATSATNSLKLSKYYFVVATRTSSGVVNFSIGDSKLSPSSSGTANQASGTPASGTENIIIGNRTAQDRTFNGLIPFLRVYKGTILTLNQITQIWSNTVGGYYGD